jgi:hypothetical protein
MGHQNGFKKYPTIDRLGHESNNGILDGGYLVVQEKLDGANGRLTWDPDEEQVVFGTRNVEYWNDKDLHKTFAHAVEFIQERIDTDELASINSTYGSVTVFGECMHAHTLPYGDAETTPNGTEIWQDVPDFICFDVWTQHSGFLDWNEARDIIDVLNLPVVPVYYTGTTDDYSYPSSDDEFPESHYRDGLPEGIVIRNEVTDQIAKHRTDAFKEVHPSQSPSNGSGYREADSVALARQFTTEARVQKQIHKFEDRGRDIEMGLMEDLWKVVFDDIIDEEYETIFLGNHVINTKEFRSEVASITAQVLQAYIERPDGSVLNDMDDW